LNYVLHGLAELQTLQTPYELSKLIFSTQLF